MLQSQTINIYEKWLQTASQEDIEFVDAIYRECEEHYDDGGDTVVECMSPAEVLEAFRDDEHAMSVREYCGLMVEQATNTRCGEDSDPGLVRAERFNDNWGPEDDRDPTNPTEYSDGYDWSKHDFDSDPDWR